MLYFTGIENSHHTSSNTSVNWSDWLHDY